MNDKQIIHTLIQLAEDGVPADASVWPALQARLAAARTPAFAKKGSAMLKPLFARMRPTRALGAASLAFLLLAAALLATPQGRVWAQSAWQFFALAAASSFSVQPEANPPAGAATAAPPSVNAAACGADLACQLASAEDILGFSASLPAGGFEGLTLRAVDAAGGILRLSYATPDGGGLVLSQSQGELNASPWEAVPAEAVQAVQIGGAAGEYVQGTFTVPAGGSAAAWNSAAPILRLRWQQDGRYFELAKLGDPEHLKHIDKAALIALAESIP